MVRVEDSTGRETLLQASGLKTGKALDVGMGGCACMAFYLARKGFDVTGIDRSSRAIHQARENAKTKRLMGAFLARKADATKLPFGDDTFDVVLAFHSLHHIARPLVAVREMFRVCRPGGKVLISDLNFTGCKIYKHRHDAGKLLESVERVARQLSAEVQTTDTRLDRLFVCTKRKVFRLEGSN